MSAIYNDLYQFSIYIPTMDFTIHQYLLAAEPAILFAAGTASQAQAILPQIKEILNGRELKYIFVSHIESDECGGVFVFQKEYPRIQVICSNLGARELPGYGYTGKLLPAAAGANLIDGELELQFFDYPSEVHMQNGLVCYEKNSGIFYSADLLLTGGNGTNQAVAGKWTDEVEGITTKSVPTVDGLKKLKNELLTIKPVFAAVGHGFCKRLEA